MMCDSTDTVAKLARNCQLVALWRNDQSVFILGYVTLSNLSLQLENMVKVCITDPGFQTCPFSGKCCWTLTPCECCLSFQTRSLLVQ